MGDDILSFPKSVPMHRNRECISPKKKNDRGLFADPIIYFGEIRQYNAIIRKKPVRWVRIVLARAYKIGKG